MDYNSWHDLQMNLKKKKWSLKTETQIVFIKRPDKLRVKIHFFFLNN